MTTYNSFVFEGHGKSEKDGSFDPGATNGNVTENQLSDSICKKVKYYLDTLAPQLKIHYDEQNFKDNDLVGNVYSCNSGISVHINSATGASGSEILVPCKEGYLGADFELVKEISNLLKIPNRGVKSRDYNSEKWFMRENGVKIQALDYFGEIRKAWDQGVSLAILEVGFIQNDLKAIQNNIDGIAFLIAKYVAGNCGVTINGVEIPTEKPQEPTPPIKPQQPSEYIVKEYSENGTFYPNDTIFFRNKPYVGDDNPIQGNYTIGESVIYDKVVITNEFVWISWISASTGIRRYMPIREIINGVYGDIWGRIE